jgi:hypothetical protein
MTVLARASRQSIVRHIRDVRGKNVVVGSEELGTKDDCAGDDPCKFTTPPSRETEKDSWDAEAMITVLARPAEIC